MRTGRRRGAALVLGAAVLGAGPAAVAALEVPFLEGRVNDHAGLVEPEARARLESALAALEQDRGAQVAVLTIPALEGEALEDWSLKVAETWKLGRGKFDDGALLLVVRDDRKLRIEVGYGLEPVLTDAISRRILDGVMRPRLRAGDPSGAIEAGVEAMVGTIRGQDVLPPPEDSRTGSGGVSAGGAVAFGLMLGLFLLVAVARVGLVVTCGFLGLLWLSLGHSLKLLPLVLVAALLAYLLHRGPLGRYLRRQPTRAGGTCRSGGSTPGGGWSGGSRSSGGGFSGGGGSFGGGGASSGW